MEPSCRHPNPFGNSKDLGKPSGRVLLVSVTVFLLGNNIGIVGEPFICSKSNVGSDVMKTIEKVRTDWVRLQLSKVLQVPSFTSRMLILPSLALVVL